MSEFLARELLKLDDCSCCEGIFYRTPREIYNRGGLDRIAYRVGVWEQFQQSMLAQLSSLDSNYGGLTTRDDDDFTIAFLDAWATVADVLTFYQEQIAQESYLRTATERFSLRQLARLIGYQLRPGVAASTLLAFTVDNAPGLPSQITLAAGTKVQSIPAQDEQPQMFETVKAIAARAEWNTIHPRLKQPQTQASLSQSITVEGTANNLEPGDKLLVVRDSERTFATVVRLEINQIANTTQLDLVPDPAVAYSQEDLALTQGIADSSRVKLTQDLVKQEILGKSWSQTDLLAWAETQGWSLEELTDNAIEQLKNTAHPAQVFVFRQRAALFGYNAAKQVLYNDDGKPQLNEDGTLQLNEWTVAGEGKDSLDEGKIRLFLDNVYEEIIPDSYIAIRKDPNSDPSIARVERVSTVARSEYGLSGKTTRIEVDTDWWNVNSFNTIRRTIVYAQSEALTLATIPVVDLVVGNIITLDSFYLGFQPGQTVILTGERADFKGVIQSENLTLKEIKIQGGYTQIVLQQALESAYIRNTVTINANVASATHGETVTEILGSADRSQIYQSFTLRQSPLTFISSDATPSGALSTLEVRANNLLWHEAPMLYGQKPNERIFVTRQTETGATIVKFGNGQTGARLPTGIDNLQAKYRKGIGLEGNVKAHQLTSLMSRPLGLKEVTNPLPAKGGAASETLREVRHNAPLTVLTLDRVVSLQDYEDFSRAFGGIAKALATWTWMGQQRGVVVTVAGVQGAAVETDLIAKLILQLRQSGDSHVPLRVMSYRQALFTLGGGIKIDGDYSSDLVLETVRQKLSAAFSFEQRAFGQGVALSEVLATIQSVPGVVHVDLDYFWRRYPTVNGLKQPLPAAVPQRSGEQLLGAELLTIDPFALNNLRELL